MEEFDKQKMLSVLTDPGVSEILIELESGEKNYSYLAERLQISLGEIRDRLSYVIEHGFVVVNEDKDGTTFRADTDKLNKIMESDENFAGVVSGLTELDQFLN